MGGWKAHVAFNSVTAPVVAVGLWSMTGLAPLSDLVALRAVVLGTCAYVLQPVYFTEDSDQRSEMDNRWGCLGVVFSPLKWIAHRDWKSHDIVSGGVIRLLVGWTTAYGLTVLTVALVNDVLLYLGLWPGEPFFGMELLRAPWLVFGVLFVLPFTHPAAWELLLPAIVFGGLAHKIVDKFYDAASR